MSSCWPTTPPITGPRRRASRLGSISRRRRSRPTRNRSTTAGSATGGPSASTAAAPTTTSRSLPDISRSNRRRLVASGVDTLEALAVLSTDAAVAKLPPRILDRLRRQAALQLGYRKDHVAALRADPARPDDAAGRGLAALPAPSRLDVFFDIEADPWASTTGSSTCSAGSTIVDGRADFTRRSGRTTEPRRRRCSSASSTWSSDRLERDPTMHVYHYGGYESGALKRLMQRHATREDEVDRLLRGSMLVDLYDQSSAQRDPGIGRVVLDQEDREVLPARARGRDHRRGLLGRRVRALDGDGRRRRSSTRSPPTTATTASRRGGCATGSRSAGSRPGRSTRTASSRVRSRATASHRRTSRPRRRRRGRARTRCAEGVPADRSERDRGATGPLAARRPPRLASPRGEAAVVGPLPADGGDGRRPDRRRIGARRARVRRGARADGSVTRPPLPVRPRAGDEAPRRRRARSTRRRATAPARSSGSTRSGHGRPQARPGPHRTLAA